MDDTTPSADQPTLVIRQDFLELWLRDTCPPYTASAGQHEREIIAPPAPVRECAQECPTDIQHAE
jgi:hypothetical protein